MEVCLQDVLNAREARVRRQQSMLAEHRAPLLCFTMNIAGPIKTSDLVERGFHAGLALLDSQLPQERILCRDICVFPTGCEAMFSVSMPAKEIKVLCESIEETHPLGRLFDMDVLDIDGKKLEREKERCCIICGAPGRACAASRAHPLAQLQAVTRQIFTGFFRDADQTHVGNCAVQSLIAEVHTTPKPGLVDRRNSGSHKDMDIHMFEASAHTLQPYFSKCVQIGQDTAHLPPEKTFSLLRDAGVQAEENMYRTTGGVNTHKGAIYTLGVLCGSIGRLWTAGKPIANAQDIFSECARIVHFSAEADFANADGKTAGERLYLEYGIRGIRGEIADGLPSVKNIGLPRFRQALDQGFSKNDAGVFALLHFIANTTDTNLHRRGGLDGANWARESVHRLLTATPYPTKAQVQALDDAFIMRNLSPGGCADLLAVTYFLYDVCHSYGIIPFLANRQMSPQM